MTITLDSGMASASPRGSHRTAVTRAVRNPVMWGLGLAMLALMIPTLAAYAIDTRFLNGINVWTKPLKFQFSIAVYYLTLAWFWGYLAETARQSRLLKGYVALSVTAAAAEMAYLMLQAARGVHSHFNVTTAWEATAYSAMGVGALIMTGTALVVGIALAWSPRDGLPGAYRLSVIIGLILTFVLGTFAGAAIAENGGHWVGGMPTDVDGLPVLGWAREGGDLRVGHFFGMHALQALPLLGLLAARLPGRLGALVVVIAAAGYAALTLGTTFQAQAGQPFLAWLG